MKKYTIKGARPVPPKAPAIEYEKELNSEQLYAVASIEGPHLVIAGAGTGKTRTLVYRVAYLVEKGVNPEAVLLLTFTRKAAQEMMRRAAGLLDDRCARVSGGTFHSFANGVLRRFGDVLGYSPSFSIVDRADAEDIIDFIRVSRGLDKKDRRFPKKRVLSDIISKSRNTGLPFPEVITRDYPQFEEHVEEIEAISEAYALRKLTQHIMDYDDLLVNLLKLLQEHDMVRDQLSQANRYIMVDEYQDTNRLQAYIAALLASEHQNIMVVGDDSQSIYSFRGADFRNIMEFPKLFPDAKVITLEQNYRSTQPILTFTNAIVATAKEKHPKKLFTKTVGDQKPEYLVARNEHEQAIFVCQRVLELREEGTPLNNIGVLFRSGWHSNELEIELGNYGIPFVKYGGIKFVEAAHVKDIVAFLRITLNPLDEVAWYRVLIGLEGVGPKTARKVIGETVIQGRGIQGLQAVDGLPKNARGPILGLHEKLQAIEASSARPSEAVAIALEHYTPIFKEQYEDFSRRKRDLETLERIASRFNNMEEFLTELALEPPDTSQDDVEPADKDDEKLILSTIHSAKGLEWHTVFIISLVDGLLPSSRSLNTDAEIEEERRLLYVAATRARRKLYLIVPQLQRNPRISFDPEGFSFSEPSRFLTEIKDFENLVEHIALDFAEPQTASRRRKGKTIPNAVKTKEEALKRIRKFFEDS